MKPNALGSYAVHDLCVAGQSAIDHISLSAKFRVDENPLIVAVGRTQFNLPLIEPVGSGKTRAALPQNLDGLAADLRAGGGAVNSVAAMRMADRGFPLRYLDTSDGNATVLARLPFAVCERRFMGLRKTPRSLVLGADAEKLIVRDLVQPARPLYQRHFEDLDWAARGVVLANSIKDTAVMDYFVASASAGRSRLCVVLTNSLPIAYIRDQVLPASSVVIASYDEFHQISGTEVPKTVGGALAAAEWVRRYGPSACIFMTMGSEGVLVVDESGTAVHVAMRRPAPWQAVQQVAASKPTALTGVGDCFAGGLMRALAAGEGCVAAAISGCCLALRWLGYAAAGPGDFVCERVGLARGMQMGSAA